MTQLPAPLTPADSDLQDFPFMPLHVARLRDSDFAATEDPEACWYAVMLWCASWHQLPAASLPEDDAVLARLCGLGRDVRTFKKHRKGALRGFEKCSDGRLYHPVVAEQAREAWRSKIEQRYRTECARMKKAAQRAGETYAAPTFDDWFAAQGLRPLVPQMSPTCPEGQAGDVPEKNAPRDRDRDRDRDREILIDTNPTQPIVDEHLRASLPEGFEQVVTAAGLRITAKNREREAAIVRDWVGIGLGLEEIVEEIRGFLAEHPGATSTLGRFDRRVRDRAARRACPRPAGEAAHALQPSGRDEFDDAPVIREALLSEFGEQTYASWLRPCGLSRDGDALIVKAQSRVAADWIRNHMIDRLRFASKAKRVEVVAA